MYTEQSGAQKFDAPNNTLMPIDSTTSVGPGEDENGQYQKHRVYTTTNPVNNTDYYLYENGEVRLQQGKTEKKLLDPNNPEEQKIIEMVHELENRDKIIFELRDKKAEEMASGNPLLERIIKLSMRSGDTGDPKPELIDGINFFPVYTTKDTTNYLGISGGQIKTLLDDRGYELYVRHSLDHNFEEESENNFKPISDDEIISRIGHKLFWIWKEGYCNDDISKNYSPEMDERAWDTALNEIEKEEAEFHKKYGEKIRDILKKKLEEYAATGKLEGDRNKIIIPFEEAALYGEEGHVIYMNEKTSNITEDELISNYGNGTTASLKSKKN